MSDKNFTTKDFKRWGAIGGRKSRPTPRKRCERCGAFVMLTGNCPRCKRIKANCKGGKNECIKFI